MSDTRYTTHSAAVEAHEMHGGYLLIDNISGGGVLSQGLQPDELEGYIVWECVPDWRTDLGHLTDAEWADADYDETRLPTF
jgi:hypothetical protein